MPSPDKWNVQSWDGEWIAGETAGGSRNNLDSFHLNPQFHITLTDPDEFDDSDLCTLLVSLIQKRERNQQDDQELISIGFVIYRIKEKINQGTMFFQYFLFLVSSGVNLDTNFFKTNRSVARSKTFCNMREVSGRFQLPPGEYVVIPSSFLPNLEGKFLLRTFTEEKI